MEYGYTKNMQYTSVLHYSSFHVIPPRKWMPPHPNVRVRLSPWPWPIPIGKGRDTEITEPRCRGQRDVDATGGNGWQRVATGGIQQVWSLRFSVILPACGNPSVACGNGKQHLSVFVQLSQNGLAFDTWYFCSASTGLWGTRFIPSARSTSALGRQEMVQKGPTHSWGAQKAASLARGMPISISDMHKT